MTKLFNPKSKTSAYGALKKPNVVDILNSKSTPSISSENSSPDSFAYIPFVDTVPRSPRKTSISRNHSLTENPYSAPLEDNSHLCSSRSSQERQSHQTRSQSSSITEILSHPYRKRTGRTGRSTVFEPKTKTFPIKDGQLGSRTIEVETLLSLAEQDLSEWTQQFMEAWDQCEWNKSTALRAMNLTLGFRYRKYGFGAESVEEILECLMPMEYNEEKFEELYNSLVNARLRRYESFEEYAAKISSTTRKDELCHRNESSSTPGKFSDSLSTE